jgi:hypothetical protein
MKEEVDYQNKEKQCSNHPMALPWQNWNWASLHPRSFSSPIEQPSIHDDISFTRFVIPGLTRNPVFFWIPAFSGMTTFAEIYDAVYNSEAPLRDGS